MSSVLAFIRCQCPSTEFIPVCQCFYCTKKHQIGHSTPDSLRSTEYRGKKIPPSSFWIILSNTAKTTTVAYIWPLSSQEHTADSISTCCLPGLSDPFLKSCFPYSWHPSCTVYGVTPPLVQDFPFAFTELQEASASPFLQLFHVPLNGNPAFQDISCSF